MNTKCIAKGHLIIEPYPSKAHFKAEASRTDCGSYPILHVDICHDSMSTVDLYDLLSHEYPPRHLPKGIYKKLVDNLDLRNLIMSQSMVSASNLALDERRERNWSNPRHWLSWSSPQIQVWFNNASKASFKMWIDWCKQMLKRKARYGKADGGVYNPFQGLRFRVRVEFHD